MFINNFLAHLGEGGGVNFFQFYSGVVLIEQFHITIVWFLKIFLSNPSLCLNF